MVAELREQLAGGRQAYALERLGGVADDQLGGVTGKHDDDLLADLDRSGRTP